MKNNKTCIICGKAYDYCPHCGSGKHNLWMTVADTENCYNIFLAINQYKYDGNASSARGMLDKCDISEISTFKSHIQDYIKDILGDGVNTSEPVVEQSVQEPVVTNTATVTEDIPETVAEVSEDVETVDGSDETTKEVETSTTQNKSFRKKKTYKK